MKEETFFEVVSECGETLGKFKTMKEARELKRAIQKQNREYGWKEIITIEEVTYIKVDTK